MKRFDINNYDTVIFDCDGVLLDINQCKVDAFKKAVSNYSKEIQNKFGKYCSNSFGISRYKKFEEFFTLFANKPFDQVEYNDLLEQYATICKKEYLVCSITEGTEQLLNKLHQKGIRTFISSGSDQDELRETFEKRQLTQYFTEIYGSPATKNEAIREIFEKHNVKNALFIGDSLADMTAAKNNNLDFVYMSDYTIQSTEQHNICIENAILHLKNLSELVF